MIIHTSRKKKKVLPAGAKELCELIGSKLPETSPNEYNQRLHEIANNKEYAQTVRDAAKILFRRFEQSRREAKNARREAARA